MANWQNWQRALSRFYSHDQVNEMKSLHLREEKGDLFSTRGDFMYTNRLLSIILIVAPVYIAENSSGVTIEV